MKKGGDGVKGETGWAGGDWIWGRLDLGETGLGSDWIGGDWVCGGRLKELEREGMTG